MKKLGKNIPNWKSGEKMTIWVQFMSFFIFSPTFIKIIPPPVGGGGGYSAKRTPLPDFLAKKKLPLIFLFFFIILLKLDKNIFYLEEQFKVDLLNLLLEQLLEHTEQTSVRHGAEKNATNTNCI